MNIFNAICGKNFLVLGSAQGCKIPIIIDIRLRNSLFFIFLSLHWHSVGDRMFLGMQDYDFSQIYSDLPVS